MKPLSANATSILQAATAASAEQNMSSHGLAQPSVDGKMITPYQPHRRPTPEDAPRIISKILKARLWQIRPTDTSAQEAVKLLAWALVPATYEEAAFWIGRMLAHFPYRDTSKDAVRVGDISAVVVEEQISLCAVYSACRDGWMEAKDPKSNPPASGWVIDQMRKAMGEWVARQNALTLVAALPEPEKKPEEPYLPWLTMSYTQAKEAGHLQDMERHLFTMRAENVDGYIGYLKQFKGYPDEFFTNAIQNKQGESHGN